MKQDNWQGFRPRGRRVFTACGVERAARVLSLVCAGLGSVAAAATEPLAPARDALAAGFRSPARADRPHVWWHWMNGSITKEGIRAELEDMKRVGLGGAQMLDVTPGFTKETLFPAGPVRWGSEAWHEHWQYALRTAAELGLELGLHNCAGWSESGGPWVTPEDSMKKVVWSETAVTGGESRRVALPRPPANLEFYRDIAVLAVPADPAPEAAAPRVTCSVPDIDAGKLGDGRVDAAGTVAFARGTENVVVTWTHPDAVERRLLVITAPYQRGADVKLAGDVEASDDGVTFRKLRAFGFPGYLFAHKGYLGSDLVLNVPFAPTRARVFRAVFKGALNPLNVAEVAFSAAYRIENHQSKTLTSPLGSVLPPRDAPLDDPAAIRLAEVLDLTGQLQPDGTLTWTPPAGRWVVLRIGYTTTGLPNHPAQDEGTGLEVDKMNAAALGRHWESALGRVLREAGPLKGTTLTSVLTDSWEAAQQNWTADFAEEFRARRGYDVRPFLPVLTGRVVESLAGSEGFLEDFRRTCSDLIVERYFDGMRRLAEAHGLKYYGEAYGGKTYNEYQAAVRTGVNMAEFWFTHDRSRYNVGGIKARASVAHTLGRRLLAAESFTATQTDAGWSAHPRLLKPIGDLAFTQGLNQIFLHSYVHQPYPALAPGFTVGSSGTNFGRLNTWWARAGAWIDYLARCQHLLRHGEFVADVLLVKHAGIGGFASDRFPAVPAGYDFDEADPSLLGAATVESGGAVRLASGATYRVLVLPTNWLADRELLQTLRRLARAGASLIGPPPLAPAGRLEADARREWQELVRQLWGPDGKGALVRTDFDVGKALAVRGVDPDCRVTVVDAPAAANDAAPVVRFLHRRSREADVYFLATTSEKPVRFRVDFRVGGRQPELWDALTGAMVAAPAFRDEGGRIALDLALGDGGSIFVVFREPRPARWITSLATGPGQPAYLGDVVKFTAGGAPCLAMGTPLQARWSDGREEVLGARARAIETVALAGPWKVEFTAPWGETTGREFARLQPWTEAGGDLRHFSGAARYRLDFELGAPHLAPGSRAWLDLGDVQDLATVTVNGREAGTWWTSPFAGDVTDLLRPGRNTLEVEVRNRWVNRLMGDDALPQDIEYQQKLKTGRSWGIIARFPEWMHDPAKIAARSRRTFTTYQTYYKPEHRLPTAGLLGPVALQFRPVLELPAP
ncbi:MAG: hypothetical protein HZC55_02135 [Verrucomicrobia bacterium]|nr:hypothetical protein [Verrucomicrobiota bacterium]